MINNVGALFPWEEDETEVTLRRYKYVGTDPRLNFGDIYDLTLKRNTVKKGDINLSVHLNLRDRIYMRYDTNRAFCQDWVEA